jgi:hypothetical protein
MVKKFSLLLATAAALCLAMSAAASASQLTASAGKLAPVGSTLTVTAPDITFTSNLLGITTCQTLSLNLTLTKNDGTTVEASGAAQVPGQEGCVNGSKKVIVTSFTVTNLTTTGTGKTGTMSFVITEDIDSLECTYTGKNVPFSYVAGDDAITFNKAAGITSTPVPCGTATVTASFTLEIKGTPVILD